MSEDLNYSVIMAVKNGVNFLNEAIESIYAQTLKPSEILVIDDHSTDSTKELLRKSYPDVSVVNNEGDGQVKAINLGIKQAKYEFVAFLDHDDLWVRNKQEIQLNLLAENNELESITSGVINFSPQGSSRELGAARVFGATSFRKSAFSKYGFLDESIAHHGIIEWWLRAERQGINLAKHADVGLMRRVHSSNSGTVNKSASRTDLFSILRKQISEEGQNET